MASGQTLHLTVAGTAAASHRFPVIGSVSVTHGICALKIHRQDACATVMAGTVPRHYRELADFRYNHFSMKAFLLYNPIVTAAFFGWLSAQIIKMLIHTIASKKFDFSRLVDTGGMPSSHAAFVTSLSTATGMVAGWQSPVFAAVLCISSIIIYDATNLRRSAGYHAEVLNEIVPQLLHGKFVSSDSAWRNLRELLGHTPFEVFVGGLLGILIAYVFITAYT